MPPTVRRRRPDVVGRERDLRLHPRSEVAPDWSTTTACRPPSYPFFVVEGEPRAYWLGDSRRARRIGIGFASIPLATAFGVAAQRHVVTDPSLDTVLVALLLVPCALNFA